MSSSNQVSVRTIKETTYGETPGVGNFEQPRFLSESLTGSPTTSESQTIRTDRGSSGQVLTGLESKGDINFEMSKEDAYDEYYESLMYSTFATSAAVAVDLTIDATAKTITRDSGDFTGSPVVSVGDILILTSFASALNNVEVMVTEVVSATVIKYSGPSTMIDEVGSGTSYQIADKISVGSTKLGFSIEKAFLDVADRALIYKGMIAAEHSLNVAYGSILNSSFTFQGNSYEQVESAGDFITDGRTLNPQATGNSMNGSIDMPFIAESSSGAFADASFCIQSVEAKFNNNLTPTTCIGELAAVDFSEGTFTIEISMSTYLDSSAWNMLSKKLDQSSFSMGFAVRNDTGFYGYFFPAIQVNFDDPAAGGINQDVLLNMTAVAKVGANGESPVTIFRG